MPARAAPTHGARWQRLTIALTAFLTLIDLFAIQAILPTLANRYGVNAAEIGAAANACTLGMAIASLGAALFSAGLDRRAGIAASLALLAVPTAVLAFVDDIAIFTLLRVVQGCLMATAFTLMLAYLGEHCSRAESAMAFAAFITGNVMSNLAGRLLSATLADNVGVTATFIAFAVLNLSGAILVLKSLKRTPPMSRAGAGGARAGLSAVAMHVANPQLRSAFAIGFLILFAFIGVFTYVNFVLVVPPLGLGMMQLGWVYLVFLPALPTTLIAGSIAARIGARPALVGFLGLALLGLPALLAGSIPVVLLGLALVAIGTFGAQAIATGFVGTAATAERGAASGVYLAAYFAGGLIGSLVIGRLFEQAGWQVAVIGIGIAVALAGVIAARLRPQVQTL